MVTGIHIKEEHTILFNQLKVDKKYRALIFGLNKDRNGIELFKECDRNYSLKDLESDLPDNDCRYVVYDFEYQTFENPPRETAKLLLIVWAPDNASIKVKVPFTATKSEIRGTFSGIQKDIQASDYSIFDFEELRKECC